MFKYNLTLLFASVFGVNLFAQSLPQLGKNPIKEVVKAMTQEEKVKFLSGIGMAQTNSEDGPVAGTIQGKVKGAAGATVEIPRLGVPSVILADGPAGLRIDPVKLQEKTSYSTAFPSGSLLASTWNTSLITQVGKAIGNEVKEFGVDVILGPGMNIQRDLLCGRNFEYFSEDPVVSGNIAAAYVNGVQSQGVGTSVKHFVANNQETSRNSINEIISPRALREIYLKGFEIAIKKSQPWTVMSSYNKINGTYTSESYDLLTSILRNEWGFKGLVMTDWFAGRNYASQTKVGNDLLMPGRIQEYKKINEALNTNELKIEEVDRNIEKILELILRSPAFKNYKYSNLPDFKTNRKIARNAAAEGMILLKNEGHALPISPKKITLLGNASYDTFTGGTGSGEMNAEYKISFYQGLRDVGYHIDSDLQNQYTNYIETAKANQPKRNNILEAIKPIQELPINRQKISSLAQNSDIAIITIGRNAGEGSDRDLQTDYLLNPTEIELIKNTSEVFHTTGKKVIVALNIDALVDVTQWQHLVDGILITWLPGQEAGNAFADVVSGKVNPSGKLAQTMPAQYTDTPTSNSFPGIPEKRPKNSYYKEGIYVGYRYYSTFNKPVAYEFGYGLSYSQFSIGKLTTSNSIFNKEIKVKTEVKNIGNTYGQEVVQLYLSAPGKSLEKPTIELKAFKKSEVLKPGNSQKIEFLLTATDLASFDTERSSWVIEPGIYNIKVGSSSKNIQQIATFTVTKEIIVEKVNNVLALQEELKEISQTNK